MKISIRCAATFLFCYGLSLLAGCTSGESVTNLDGGDARSSSAIPSPPGDATTPYLQPLAIDETYGDAPYEPLEAPDIAETDSRMMKPTAVPEEISVSNFGLSLAPATSISETTDNIAAPSAGATVPRVQSSPGVIVYDSADTVTAPASADRVTTVVGRPGIYVPPRSVNHDRVIHYDDHDVVIHHSDSSELHNSEVERSRLAKRNQEFSAKLQQLHERLQAHGPEPGVKAKSRVRSKEAPLRMPGLAPGIQPHSETGNEDYARIEGNDFISAQQEPLSTFSIDVDTASYSNIRRFISDGRMPPPDAVRIEEMINYFDYTYDPPSDTEGAPFSANFELGPCPWNEEHRLVRIGLKGKTFEDDERPPVNLVFLIDVSGSMNQPNKLPLVKESLQMLVKKLTDRDRISIVVYRGAAGVVLPPTSCEQRKVIERAIERLQAGGSTAGGAGIQLAYDQAQENFVPEQVNRVILCTDGDFNVGISSESALNRLIEEKAKTGIFLTVLGFGRGNLKDARMEMLADRGNGNYGYIDTLLEAHKMLVEQSSGTLVTIAKDVKIQVDFNASRVGAYRLIGYENRKLAARDFRDDTKDAGEIGAGHTVTALYEIVPPDKTDEVLMTEPSRYQTTAPTSEADTDELLTVRLRYKQPDGDTSTELKFPLKDEDNVIEETSSDFRFAAAVAQFGLLLRGSKYKGTADLEQVLDMATEAKGADRSGFRTEFIEIVRQVKNRQY